MNVVAMNVTGRMTEKQYEQERSKIAATKNEAKAVAGVRWEQELAALFYRSGWTLEELAERERKSFSWIRYAMAFGKFLGFCSKEQIAGNLPNNLSVRRFRSYLERTERGSGNERIRFQQIIKMMQEETTLQRPHKTFNHGPAIKKDFGDGKWHALDTITGAIDAPKGEVERTLQLMHEKGTYSTKTECKRVGGSFHYRIFPQDKTVSVKELKEKLVPIIEELMIQGRANAATVSISTVRHSAARLQKLLDEWLEKDD